MSTTPPLRLTRRPLSIANPARAAGLGAPRPERVEAPDYPLQFLPEFKDRRRALAKAIASAGGEWVQTGGGFFALARFPGCEDSFAAALRLLDTARVLTIPGGLFGKAGEGFLRLSYGGATAEALEEAVGRIAG